MKILSSFTDFTTKSKVAFRRFPATIIWAIIGSFFTVWFIEQDADKAVEFTYIKILLTFILGVSWFTATHLLIHYFKENQDKNKQYLLAIPLVLLIFYYVVLPDNEVGFNEQVGYRFFLFLLAGHLSIFFSPFIFTWNKKAYWNYLKNIFIAFVKSTIFSLVLYLGLTLALLALKYLFKLDFNDKIYFELFVISLGIVNTGLFLSNISTHIHQQINIDYPKALLIFVKYILIPLTLLYLIILYAYSFKIVINWNLPKGWVSYLVIALSILGFSIHILINPIRKTSESRLIRNFYPRFYYALIPMLLLLFIAIFKRITTYGFTENRYLIVVLSFWILGITLYILGSKRKKLRYLPMSIAILALVASFGFWGMFSISKNSQAKQFKKVFTKMKAKDFKVLNSEYRQFESITHYLSKRNALNKISEVLGYNPSEVFDEASHWEISTKLKDSLGIKITDHTRNGDPHYRHYNTIYQEMIDVKGYDYMIQTYFSTNSYQNNNKSTNLSQYQYRLDSITHTDIHVLKANDTIKSLDLKPFIHSLRSNKSYDISREKMTIVKDFDTIKIKILVQNIETRTKKNDTIIPEEITHLSAIILLKEKE